MSERQSIRVVAGLVVEKERVLISKRRASQAMPLYWEFPGGKVHEGESPQDALKREFNEELGVDIKVGKLVEQLRTQNESVDIELQFYSARLSRPQTPRCIEVAAWTWATKNELCNYRFLPADEELLMRLSREGLPSFIIA